MVEQLDPMVAPAHDDFAKTALSRPYATVLEALGLQWLAEPMAQGGAFVVPHTGAVPGRLSTRRIHETRVDEVAAFEFGRALARTHAAGAAGWGAPPAGWQGDGYMGRKELRLPAANSKESLPTWGEFFAEQRILPCMKYARENGSMSASDVKIVEKVAARISRGDFSSAQPALLAADAPARIHGDLWTGNVLWARKEDLQWAPQAAGTGSPEGNRDALHNTVGVIIDPAAQGGHAETDLAYLEVFGQPYLDRIYAGYNSVSKLQEGWKKRMGIHQLHILAVHAAIFGGSYGRITVATAMRYV
ncbi:fructosamine kinase family protein [Winkia neuii]|uniref:fructosamine kinase family protein n=1 Tax=Winkia neuii TaxID=33007 RepID=UPI0023A9E3A2|nr:fructosamine kinase family protein [Winkia neuii]WEB73054.1 fructosamine kinase family protein [Winkia neuii]